MRTRIIAALIAIPIVVIPIYLGGIWGLALGVVITVLSSLEMFYMLRVGGYNPSIWIGVPWAVMLFLSGWDASLVQRSSISITGILTEPTVKLVQLISFPTASVLIAGFIVTLTYSLFIVDKPINTWMATSIGAIFLGVTLGQVVALRFLPNGFWYVLFGFLVTWANDSAAYFTGVFKGKRKLWPRLSPKKTWEGTIGGWVAATLAGAFLAWALPVGIGPLFGAIIGFLAGILALFGDLSISMIKRQVGVKDTGNFFVGHGGMLDRLDSLLFTLPFIYQALIFFAKNP
ncbi:MAG: phosphatidate cytidylyltransferase [Anaerolineales bacterium]|nr:phosphatidate cytidylyltransferase [Anaerolineales bacterium]